MLVNGYIVHVAEHVTKSLNDHIRYFIIFPNSHQCCLYATVSLSVYEIRQKIASSQTWQLGILCGSVCTGKNCGLMGAPLYFDTGPAGNQTLAWRSVSPQALVTQDVGQMITAPSLSHSSVTQQVMHIISAPIGSLLDYGSLRYILGNTLYCTFKIKFTLKEHS